MFWQESAQINLPRQFPQETHAQSVPACQPLDLSWMREYVYFIK